MFSSLSASNTNKMKKSKSQQTVSYEVFKDHWKQAQAIFTKSIASEDDIEIVKNNLSQMIFLLMDELNTIANLTLNNNNMMLDINGNTSGAAAAKKQHQLLDVEINNRFHGPIWSYLISNNIFETVYLWSLSYPEFLHDLKCEQLKYYDSLINHMQANEQTNLLLYAQLYKPLFALLNHCSSHTSEEIERYCIAILNQLCVCVCKNSHLLNVFFDLENQNPDGSSHQSMTTSSSFILNNSSEYIFERAKNNHANSKSRTFIFSLLIPYIHKEGCLGFECGTYSYGQQARDTLLMIMQLSSRNSNLAKYVVDCTDFCPVLATGLSALYSGLPQKFVDDEDDNDPTVRYLLREDILNSPNLNKFINSLEFCNNVIQVSHSLIANQLMQYIYYGFLVPVCAPALTQNNKNEIVAATCYLDLFLRTVNEPNLLKLFLKFILYAKFDERITLLDTLIARVSSCDKLSVATLMLFYTMIELDSEDVMYRLVFSFLLPSKHLLDTKEVEDKSLTKKKETESERVVELLSLSVDKTYFDSLMVHSVDKNTIDERPKQNYLYPNSSVYFNENNPINRWLNSIFNPNELPAILCVYDQMGLNLIDYLRDAQHGIRRSADRTLKWSHNFDTSETNIKSSQLSNSSQNLTNTDTLPTTNSCNPQFHELDYDPDEFLLNLKINSATLDEPPTMKSNRSTMNLVNGELKEKKKSKKVKKPEKTRKQAVNKKSSSNENSSRNRTNDFYTISFDNELSETESAADDQNTSPEESVASSSSASASSSSSSIYLMNKSEDNADNDSTTASMTSNTTINNSSVASSSHKIDPDGSLSPESRDKLVDYLFMDKENKEAYLNSGLTEFLVGLDRFFIESNIKTRRVKPREIDMVLEQIIDWYNLSQNPNKPEKPNQLEESNSQEIELVSQDTKEEEKPNQTGNQSNLLTSFPVYQTSSSSNSSKNNGVSDSFNSSTDSLNTNSQTAIDSGIESTKDFASKNQPMAQQLSEIEILGPFLTSLLSRLDLMLNNSLEVNLILTGLIARLAYYHQYLLRSFLFNSPSQSQYRSLMQILKSIRDRIEINSKNLNNFSLIYLKAKLHLVRRLMNKCDFQNLQGSPSHLLPIEGSRSQATASPQINMSPQVLQQQQQQTPTKRKSLSTSFNMNKLLSKLFKPPATTVEVTPASVPTQPQTFRNEAFGLDSVDMSAEDRRNSGSLNSSLSDKFSSLPAETDVFDDSSIINNTSLTSSGRDITQSEFYDFIIADNEWQEPRVRNLAFGAVLLDEFVKELAAICQEQSVFSSC